MSHQAVNWAIEQRAGGPSPKATLWSIANYANENWCSWPSQKTIAEESEQSLDTVQRRVRDLEDMGLVRRIPLHFAGRRSVDFFILKPSSFFGSSLDDIEPLLPRGYVIAPNHAAATCGSVDDDKTATESGVSGPDAAANAAANAAATVRQQENLGTKEGGDGHDARARGGLTPEAHTLSADIAKLCGHDIAFLPPRWARDGARIAQAWLDAGYSTDMMFDEVRLIMARKRDGKPENLTYFDKPFAREHALRAQPHQVPTVKIESRPQEVIHGKAHVQSTRRVGGASHSSLAAAAARRAVGDG